MAQYKKIRSPFPPYDVSDQMILETEKGLWIPADPENKDYQNYLAWVEEGNAPLDADPAPVEE